MEGITVDLLGLHFGVAGSLTNFLQVAGFVDIVDETRRMPYGKSWTRSEIGVQGTLSITRGFRNVSGVITKTGLLSPKEEYEHLNDKLAEEWDVHGNHYRCKVVCVNRPEAFLGLWKHHRQVHSLVSSVI